MKSNLIRILCPLALMGILVFVACKKDAGSEEGGVESAESGEPAEGESPEGEPDDGESDDESSDEGGRGAFGGVSDPLPEDTTPFDPSDAGALVEKTVRLADELVANYTATGSGRCLAAATGDASYCADLAKHDKSVASWCRAWAVVHEALSNPAACEKITDGEGVGDAEAMTAICRGLANYRQFDCQRAMGLTPPDQRDVVARICKMTMASDKPVCVVPEDKEREWEHDACLTMTMVRALKANDPNLCADMKSPLCKATVAKTPAVCVGLPPTVTDSAALVAALRKQTRSFVLGDTLAAEGPTTIRGELYAANLFPQSAKLKARIVLAGEGGAADTVVEKELGTLAAKEGTQKFALSFEIAPKQKYEVSWSAEWAN